MTLAETEKGDAQIEPCVLFVSKNARLGLDVQEQDSPSEKSIEVGFAYGDGAHGEQDEEQAEG